MKRLWFLSFLLLLVSLAANSQNLTARQGRLDLRNTSIKTLKTVSLSGEWEFYMSQLLAPEKFVSGINEPRDFIAFPNTWNELSKSQQPGFGFATYRLLILLKSKDELALEIPHCYSNYSLWINGKLIAKNGRVGESLETSVAQWLPMTVELPDKSDSLDLILQISNFHHAKGGIREEIVLGTVDELLTKRDIATTMNVVVMGSLIVLACAFVLIYFISKRNFSAIYFAALAITWGVRSCFSNLYIGTYYFTEAFSWTTTVRIEYVTLYLTMIFALLFLHALFKDDTSAVFKYFFVSCNVIFIIFTLILQPKAFTQFLPVYLSFALILLLYIIYVVVHAVIKERPGVWLIVSCIMMGVLLFGYDLGAYQGLSTYNSILINGGYVVIFLMLGAALMAQLGLTSKSSGRKDILTYDDLYRPSK